ncbi:MAG: hypothetical protein ABDH20_06925, partial [Thermus sp.]
MAQALPGARVLLRVNPDLPVRTHGHLATGRGESQFGALPEDVPRRRGGLGRVCPSWASTSTWARPSRPPRTSSSTYRVLHDLFPAAGPVAVWTWGAGSAWAWIWRPWRSPCKPWQGGMGPRSGWSRAGT